MDRGGALMALRLVVAAALAHGAQADAAVPECATVGASYVDQSIKILNGGQPEDAFACQSTCAMTPGCSVFTYYTDSKGCWMLTSLAKIRSPALPSDQFAVSGPRACVGKQAAANTAAAAEAAAAAQAATPAVTPAKPDAVTSTMAAATPDATAATPDAVAGTPAAVEDTASTAAATTVPATTTGTTASTTTPDSGLKNLSVNEEGLVTVAPGFEISPTGIRPVAFGGAPAVLGAGFEQAPTRSPDEVNAFGYTVKIDREKFGLPEEVFGVGTIAGYSWVWWAIGSLLVLMCACCLCCGCCCGGQRKRRTRSTGVVRDMAASEATETVSREPTDVAEQVPLVIKDAGLRQPRLQVPELPMPQLQIPQLVPVPASQASLHPSSPGGAWSPGHGQFVRMPMSPSRGMYP